MNSILAVMLLVIITVVELKRKRQQIFDALFFFNVHFGLAYALVPLAIALYPRYPIGLPGVDRPIDIPVENVIYSIVSYVMFLVGWYLAAGRTVSWTPQSFRSISKDSAYRVCFYGIVGSAACLVLYFMAFGGLNDALENGSKYRFSSGFRANFEIGPTSAFSHLIPMAVLVFFYTSMKLFIEKDAYRKVTQIGLLVASVIILALYIPVTAGRGFILNLFVGLYVIQTAYTGKTHLIKALPLIAFAACLMIFGKQAIATVPHLIHGDIPEAKSAFTEMSKRRLKSKDPFKNGVVRESLHCSESLAMSRQVAGENVPYTYFRDYAYVLPSLLPERLLGLNLHLPPTVSLTNTRLLIGLNEASTPPGLVGSCYYSCGIVGIVIGLFTYGFIGRLAQNSILLWCRVYRGALPFAFITFHMYGGYAVNGDPKVYLFDSLAFIIGALAVLFGKRRIVHRCSALSSVVRPLNRTRA